jgi:polyisoprenoid-binding protein YceI
MTAAAPPEEERRSRRVRWLLWSTGALVLIVIGAVGLYVWSQYRVLKSSKYNVIAWTVPDAPRLSAQSGETIYRIDPTHSDVSYDVQEKLFGHNEHRAHGTTNGIAGDIALNDAHPAASRVGQIVVNVEELHSDNNLRDAQIRSSYLSSHDYPLADLTVSSLQGLPASIQEGHHYHFTMRSQLTVKKTPAPVLWDVDASVAGGKLTATATAHVKLSTFAIGPISIGGLVSTGDDATLTMHLTALDPSKFKIPDEISPPKDAARPKTNVSFAKTIMPALQSNCASCHQPGQVGAAHWTLATAQDAANVSDGIGSVVESGYMPPWPASDAGVPLAHSKRLDKATIDAIVSWSRAGGPLDVDGSTKLPPIPGPLGPPPRHDVTLQMPEGYAGSLAVPNDYRCFILDPHFTQETYVTGYEVTPDKREEIHHVQIFHVNKSQADAGRQLSGKDGKPGWSCYGSVELPDSSRFDRKSGNGTHRRRLQGFTGQPGLFAGWVPGQDPVVMPPNTGVLFEPGDVLVFQVHYHYDRTPVPDRSTVALQVDKPTPKFKEIDIINPIAPVEIPCNKGVKAKLCDRDAAIADDARLYGPIGAAAEGGLLALCGKTPDELAATFHKTGIAETKCDYTVPESGTIIAVLGHEHTLGKTFRFTLDPDTPKQKILLDIPTWNFDWQMNYGLAQPLHVTQGQKLRMECSWDRSLDPNRAPKYIVFAEGTEDEMCFGTYAIVPDDQTGSG